MRPYRLELARDRRGKYRWTLKAGNGRTIVASSQGYHDRIRAIENALAATARWPKGDVVEVLSGAETALYGVRRRADWSRLPRGLISWEVDETMPTSPRWAD